MKNEKDPSVESGLENGVLHATTILSSPYLGDAIHSNGDHENVDESEEDHPNDYSHLTKKELVDIMHGLSQNGDFKKSDNILREVKSSYDEIFEKEKSEALARYQGQEGAADGFEYKGDESDQAFGAALKLIRDKKNQFFKSQEEQKSGNLHKKLELLDKLRALVDSEDSDQSFQHFKQLQQEWKGIGPVAVAQVKTLWANYSALVDRFYDHRSIYFELKELDRKKNLETKLELCERAEKLGSGVRMKDAIRELNELHSEFKHVGPVPKEEQELVWQRFKAASDAVYAHRDAYLSELQQSLQKALDEKMKLIDELQVFASFHSDRIKEWNFKTQEILQLQKKWEVIGAIPRAGAKDVNKKFWHAFKLFFSNKNTFFKKLDEERDKNVNLKTEIIRKAQELQGSSDWEKTATDLKELQRQWKEVGPVPEKLREKLFQEFRLACDHFFEQRREQFDKADREQLENLREKEIICAELERLAAEKSGSLVLLSELQAKFGSFGFVPKSSISAIKSRYNDAVQKFLSSIEIPVEEKSRVMLEFQLSNLKNDPQADRKIFQKEQVIRKRITTIENDIAVLRNNLEFFGRSKNAEKFKEEFNAKIVEASGHLTELKSQLKMLRAVAH